MRRFGLSVILSSCALAASIGIARAETPEAGRYLVVEVPVVGSPTGTKQTMMVDTQYGRSWILVLEGGTAHWKRIYFDVDSNPPQGQQRRPAPVTPSAPN